MKSVNRVAINSGILYFKSVITITITLYSTRLILNALGVLDFGIYSLVSGVVLMLSFLNTAMSSSTQRYLSYYFGKNELSMQQRVFSNSLLLHIVIAIFLSVLLFIAGFFLFDGFLNIPLERVETAKWVYYFMIISVFFTIISVPFTASINANEDMIVSAIVNTVEVLLKLSIALLLFTITLDRLFIYALLIAVSNVLAATAYLIFSIKKYDECDFKLFKNKDDALLKELSFFAGWNLFGTLSFLSRQHGLAIILNIFFGAAINAAYSIAYQVAGQLTFLSATMLSTLNPQIMKSEGAGDRERMLRISSLASKLCFFLVAILAIPLYFHMEYVLTIWLNVVPKYTAEFCKLILIYMLIYQWSVGIMSAVQAIGNIKVYQTVVGLIQVLMLPITYLLMWLGYDATYVLYLLIGLEILSFIFRVCFLNIMTKHSKIEYIKEVVILTVFPLIITLVLIIIVNQYIVSDLSSLLINILIVAVLFSVTFYFISLSKPQKLLINNLFEAIAERVKRKVI
ncbi:hypothetical protein EKM02_07495 [Flavobacterium sp. RSP49]|uniref:MATE family efflux transporter n=1 Tax=Flavobacterium sp. RSP49 TaxID=2497487 RepID=UPI000F83C028|nr:MATE family efflux transporter [Flavobacterium sp. RSP49]RTZ00905.1 hypothetical protein EKM02_07495 [Flavobacterium sp. RSP49]